MSPAATRYHHPWRVEEDELGFAVYSSDGDLVCLIGDEHHHPEDYATALLLSLSPELARVLRDYHRLQREGCNCHEQRRYVCVACRAEQVLARIERTAS